MRLEQIGLSSSEQGIEGARSTDTEPRVKLPSEKDSFADALLCTSAHMIIRYRPAVSSRHLECSSELGCSQSTEANAILKGFRTREIHVLPVNQLSLLSS